MKFIELTYKGGAFKIFINFSLVTEFYRLRVDGYTTVCIQGVESEEVSETPEEILKLIKETEL